MATGDYPQYTITIALSNGMSITTWFGAAIGLPTAVEDQLAAAAAKALQNFNWSSLPLNPVATSAAVTLVRQDVAVTDIPLA